MTKVKSHKFTISLGTLQPLEKRFPSSVQQLNHRVHFFWAHKNISRGIGSIISNMSTAIEHGLTFCKEGQRKEEPNSLNIMYQGAMQANPATYARLLQGCGDTKSVKLGRGIHARVMKSGYEVSRFVNNHLVNMYAKCGSIVVARQVFDKMPMRNLFSWNTIIAGYDQDGYGEEALLLFRQMHDEEIEADQFTFSSVLNVCASLAALKLGKQVHAAIAKAAFRVDVILGTALVDMYAKCGRIDAALQVFDKMHERNVVSWSVIISGYAQNGLGDEALELFLQVHREGMKPNQFTLSSVVRACAMIGSKDLGEQTHSYIVKTGFASDIFVGSALVDMHAKCGNLEDACRVFGKIPKHDRVSWSAMIAGYAQNGHGEKALELLREMQLHGVRPDEFVFSSVLSACGSLADLEHGKSIHAVIIKTGFELDEYAGNSIVDMYAKCRIIHDACQVFDKLPKLNVESLNSMITGYAQNGYGEEGFKLFRQVQRAGMNPNQFTFSSVLKACASLANLEQGKQVHSYIMKTMFRPVVFVESALVDMYAKCGCIEDAQQVFSNMAERNVVSWNAIIAACAHHGLGKEALQCFEQMQQAGMEPNYITFICILSACSHAGLVDEGRLHFYSMTQDHGITPRTEHYTCMVDLLGRAGCIDEAENLINAMPIKPDASLWGALLSACKIHGNMELGKYAAECLFELEPGNTGAYVLLSNIYAAAGRWDDVKSIRKMLKDCRVKKEPGCSWIEIKNKVHAFIVDDRSHPKIEEILAMLERLTDEIKEIGYVPSTNFVLHDLEEEEQEHLLCHHSEKLALGFGFIGTPPLTPI